MASGPVLVVFVGRSTNNSWWRHFLTLEPVDVGWHGEWRTTTAQAFTAGSPEHTTAAATYVLEHPRINTSHDPVVLIKIPEVPVAAPTSDARMSP